MKTFLLAILLISAAPCARADLLERIRLEDALRKRVEDAVKVYDPAARVLLRLDYRSYEGDLPGTSSQNEQLNVSRVDTGDITKAVVEVFSEDPKMFPPETKDFVLPLIPAERGRVSFVVKQQVIPPKKVQPGAPKPLDKDALSQIASETVQSFVLLSGLLAGVLTLAFFAFSAVLTRRRTSQLKDQVGVLAKSISEISVGGSSAPTAMPSESRGPTSISLAPDRSALDEMSSAALEEVFADCYWCEQDGYASWLWKRVPAEKRAELLKSVAFMKVYCASFLDIDGEELSYHEHPYYLDPSGLKGVSQGDLAQAVRANLPLWHGLSPLRQQCLPLSLQEKLRAMQAPPVKTALPSKASEPRKLKMKPAWGVLSLADEQAVFENPDLIPASLRSHVKSLVWLAQKDPSSIQKILSKYDARALAAAWIGPDDVLKKLESALPEKKLKLLETYRGKTPAARTSSAFLGLVDEGLKQDAA